MDEMRYHRLPGKLGGLGLHEIVELLGQAILKLSIQYGLPSRVEHGVEVVDQRLGRWQARIARREQDIDRLVLAETLNDGQQLGGVISQVAVGSGRKQLVIRIEKRTHP